MNPLECFLLPLAASWMALAPPALAEPALVSLYECLPCTVPPTLDGRLDDPAWQGLPEMSSFYLYWSQTPKPPPLRTHAKVCYDATSLYIGITLFDDQMDKIRATVRNRDNSRTWSDDCVEIYFDPGNSGNGYIKFTTNSLGARYDEKSVQMVGDAGWNSESWKAKTTKGPGAWTIELAASWEALEAKPSPGALWGFDLVRYGYSSGKFRGVSWSLGGSYASPQNFGYLFFGKLELAGFRQLEKLRPAIIKTKGGDFVLFSSRKAITCIAGQDWSAVPMKDWVLPPLAGARASLDEAQGSFGPIPPGKEKNRLEKLRSEILSKLDKLQQQLNTARPLEPSDAVIIRENARQLNRSAQNLKWDSLLTGLVLAP